MTTIHGPLIALPYTLEINDSVIYAVEKHASIEIGDVSRTRWRRFLKRQKKSPAFLTVALHPHLIGTPHRIGYLSRMLDVLLGRSDTIFMTGSEIADWFIAADRTAQQGE